MLQRSDERVGSIFRKWPRSARPEAISLISPDNPLFRKARLFRGLSPSEVNETLHLAEYREYRANSTLAEQGGPADRLFLLVTGSARYFFISPDGRRVCLFWLLPGDAFGGTTLLTEPGEFIVSTEATTESLALVWQRDVIRALAMRYPKILENGLSIACDYLVWYVATHLSLISHTARERLAHVIFSLAQGIGRRTPRGVSLKITNEQLANTANMTSFTVSRLLNEWQRDGLIAKDRGRLLLYRPEQLLHRSSTSGFPNVTDAG